MKRAEPTPAGRRRQAPLEAVAEARRTEDARTRRWATPRTRARGPLAALFVALAVLASPMLPAPAFAQAAVEAEPRFLLEEIVVEGLSWSSERTVLSEARLAAGESYDEAALKAALDRINRLPFVLSAEPRLSRGSEPGAYRLTLAITETNRFFISGEQGLVLLDDPFSSPDRVALFEEDFEVTRGIRGGVRHFVGSYGELFAAIDNGAGLQLGARHYNLFGRGIVGTLVLRRDFLCCRSRIFPLALDPNFSWWSVEAEPLAVEGRLSVPLGRDHGLFAAFEDLRVADGTRRDAFIPGNQILLPDRAFYAFEDLHLRRLELGWRADTTDDPVTPLRGSILSAWVEGQELVTELQDIGRTPLSPFEAHSLRFGLSGGKTLPVGLRQAVFGEARLALGRSEIEGYISSVGDGSGEIDSLEGGVRLGHRARLWAEPSRTTRPELWLETSLSYDSEEADPRDGAGFLERSLEKRAAETALVLRSSWGVLRLSVSWIDWQGYER